MRRGRTPNVEEREERAATPSGRAKPEKAATGSNLPIGSFLVISLFLEHFSAKLEDERGDVDRQVCTQESKSDPQRLTFHKN